MRKVRTTLEVTGRRITNLRQLTKKEAKKCGAVVFNAWRYFQKREKEKLLLEAAALKAYNEGTPLEECIKMQQTPKVYRAPARKVKESNFHYGVSRL